MLCIPPAPELLAGGTHVYDATGQGLPLHEGGREGDGGELGVPGIIIISNDLMTHLVTCTGPWWAGAPPPGG